MAAQSRPPPARLDAHAADLARDKLGLGVWRGLGEPQGGQAVRVSRPRAGPASPEAPREGRGGAQGAVFGGFRRGGTSGDNLG